MLGVLLMPGMMGISPVLATGSDELENLLSGLPILPEKANERIETSSSNIAQWKLRIFFSTMSKPEMLGINLLPIGLSPDVLDRPVAVEINNSTKGELLALILQINRLAAVQFNESTVLIIPVADRKNFQLGKKSRKIYQLVYAPTSRVLAFIDTAPALQNLINRQNIFEHVEGNSILVIDTPENIAIMDSVVNMIDAKPNKIQARIPISFLDESSFKSAIAALGTDVTDRIDVNSIYYSTEGRSLIVYDSPENVEFLRNVVRKIDLAPRQVLIDTAIKTWRPDRS